VLCYSIAGAAFTAVVAVLKARDAYEFLSLFSLCLSALFVCAALTLSVIRLSRGRWLYAAFSAAWVSVSGMLAFSLGEGWEAALGEVPVVLSCAVALAGAAVFIYQISKMLTEVEGYAVA
jgi:hypothetical protein